MTKRRWGAYGGQSKGKGYNSGKAKGFEGKAKGKGKGGKESVSFSKGKQGKGVSGASIAPQLNFNDNSIDDNIITFLKYKGLPGDLLQDVQKHFAPEVDRDPPKPRWQEVQSIQAKIKAMDNNIQKADDQVQEAQKWWDYTKHQRDSLLERRQELHVKLEAVEAAAADNDSESQLRGLSKWTRDFVDLVQRHGASSLSGNQELSSLFENMPDVIVRGIHTPDDLESNLGREQPSDAPMHEQPRNLPWIRKPESGLGGSSRRCSDDAFHPRASRGRAASGEPRRRSASRSPPPVSEAGNIGTGRGRRPTSETSQR